MFGASDGGRFNKKKGGVYIHTIYLHKEFLLKQVQFCCMLWDFLFPIWRIDCTNPYAVIVFFFLKILNKL